MSSSVITDRLNIEIRRVHLAGRQPTRITLGQAEAADLCTWLEAQPGIVVNPDHLTSKTPAQRVDGRRYSGVRIEVVDEKRWLLVEGRRLDS